MGITSLIIGIISGLISIIPVAGYVIVLPAIIGITLGIIDIVIKIKKKESGKGVGLVGIIMSIIAIVFVILWTMAFVWFENALEEERYQKSIMYENERKSISELDNYVNI